MKTESTVFGERLVTSVIRLISSVGSNSTGGTFTHLARFVFEFDYTLSPWVFFAGIGGGALCALGGGYLGLRGVLQTPPLATLREA